MHQKIRNDYLIKTGEILFSRIPECTRVSQVMMIAVKPPAYNLSNPIAVICFSPIN